MNETRKTRAAAQVRARAAWDALIIAATEEAEAKEVWKKKLKAAETAEIEWHTAVKELAAVGLWR